MGFDNDVEQPSGSREKPTGPTPSVAKLKRIMGTSPGCRDFTPYEIELLRKTKQEIAGCAGEAHVDKNRHQDNNANLE